MQEWNDHDDQFWEEDRFIEDDALLQASRDGVFTTLKRLVEERGLDVNFSTPLGMTPLILASKNGHEKIVKYLVKHGADMDHLTEEGDNALIWAIVNGHEDIAVYLIEHGASLEYPFLLTDAVDHQEESVIKTLLEYGVGVNYETLRIAVESGNQDILEYLVEHTTTDKFPIMTALTLGKLDTARYLVDQGGEIKSEHPNYIKEYSKDLKRAQEQVLDDLLSRPSAEPALKKSIQRFLKNK